MVALSAACEASAPAGPAASPSTEPAAMSSGDPCQDAQTYRRRASAANEPVRSALQRIAETKSRQCAGAEKTSKAEEK
jgi:hypothetical protein